MSSRSSPSAPNQSDADSESSDSGVDTLSTSTSRSFPSDYMDLDEFLSVQTQNGQENTSATSRENVQNRAPSTAGGTRTVATANARAEGPPVTAADVNSVLSSMMLSKMSSLPLKVDPAVFKSLQAEVESTKQELAKHREQTELIKASLRNELSQVHDTISNLEKREEILSQELQLRLSNGKKQEEELEMIKSQLDRTKCEKQESEKSMKVELDRQIKSLEEKAAKSKEEFGRRLVETQKKLSQAEINFEKFKSDQETKIKEREIEMERKLFSAEEEVNRLKSDLSNKTSNEDQLNELKAQIEMWQTKYEELCQKIEPFKEQLDEYEAERNALLCQNSQAKDEVAKLGQQYAKLLGHQNKKQKIHHVIKLKEENNNLKAEITKLRDQAEKQKRAMKKLEEKVDQVSGKKRFNPAEAFSHHKKENMPLSVLSNGNGAVKP